MRMTVCAALVLALGACGDCPDAFELREAVELDVGRRVVLVAPEGAVRISGRERSALVEVEARGCRGRGGARIVTDTSAGALELRVVAAQADVRVSLPAGAELDVRHGSGDVDVRAVGPLTLETRGGDVNIEQVIGGLAVRAGPGVLYVREIVGDVDVVDGPGALFIENVMGGVRVRDGSGGIHLREIEGDVVVEADGSGAIDARDLAGALTVRAKSDDVRMIRWNDVAGGVSLPDGVAGQP